MPATASFDITSPVDFQEIDNALNQARKEVGQRFDFKGAKAEIDLNATDKTLTLIADEEFQRRQRRTGLRRHRPQAFYDSAGNPNRGRARDREIHQRPEAEESAGL